MYSVVTHRTEDGISASVPALPGCWSEGDTEAEALASIQDAIREYLAALECRRAGGRITPTESARQRLQFTSDPAPTRRSSQRRQR